MITPPKLTFTEKLMQRIGDVYKEQSKLIVERHKKEMSNELDYLMDELVTRASSRIEEMLSVQDLGHELRIIISKDNRKVK